jgi:site-specific DNA recombinase
MRKAILYIRVSTDEQADKGYSLQHQEERLRKYCEMQNIQVVELYKEDYSAKTFKRPTFIKLLSELKKHRAKADLLIFTKWDRFSRNTSDAYGMISTLNKLGTEPQAIEQPLDLSIPENKIMLAFYLAAPEVENDRRALNVFVGMRRAKKEGRWMATAPKGYKNITNEESKKVIVPSVDAPIIKWAFEELSKGIYHIDEIRKKCNLKGLKCSKNNFWHLIKNPAYCGKIQIPAYKDEEASIVKASHEQLVSEELFEKVQDVLTGRKRKLAYKICAKEELPLRGFIVCPKCGKKLTGSASTGGSGIKHFYYHCTKGCPERTKAFEINDTFSDYLKTIIFKVQVKELYQSIVKVVFTNNSENKAINQHQIQGEIQKNRERLNNAQQMMLDGAISPEDYKEIKKRYEPIIDGLVQQHLGNTQADSEFKKYLKKGLQIVKSLDSVYDVAPLAKKQQLIRSICKENLQFANKAVRTITLNKMVELVSSVGGQHKSKKNGTDDVLSPLSHHVTPIGFEPMAHSLEGCCSIQLSYGTSI